MWLDKFIALTSLKSLMKFWYKDLGHRSSGEIVEVNLKGQTANVQLMDSSNFSSYKNNRNYRSIGGAWKTSPIRWQIPRSGHWYVTLDFGGFSGRVNWSVNVLPGLLKPIPQSSLSSLVNENPPGIEPGDIAHDVFISHASEDKDDVVRPLVKALREGGLDVWYDEFELRIGDSLRRKIDRGLASSKFGIVVLSEKFFSKGWTNYELDGIVTRSVDGSQVLLPIWHNVTKQQVVNYSSSLADKVARTTATHTIQEIADEIVGVILSSRDGN